MRDFDRNPYSADEKRVAELFWDCGVGGGDDPIGSLIASHQVLAAERLQLRHQLKEALEMNQHVMQCMDRTGHTELTWDPTKPVEVSAVQSVFDKLIKEGYSAFRVDEDNEQQGPRLTAFDPQAGKIMMVPRLVGG